MGKGGRGGSTQSAQKANNFKTREAVFCKKGVNHKQPEVLINSDLYEALKTVNPALLVSFLTN